MIDLHVHTNISDGTFSPEEVIRLAAQMGVMAIALTDHDTVAGVERGQTQGAAAGVEVISGVEVSTQRDQGILHMLGYFIDPRNRQLLNALDYLKNGRQERIPRIISKLKDCGVDISANDVYELTIGGVPGRPHVANVLVQKKYAATLQDAFDLYLRKGAPAYVDKAKLPAAEAIRVITEAGGLPVLAHPYSLREDDPVLLQATVGELKEYGLKGIEAYYPVHTREQTDIYVNIASRLDLAVTGGTDFHGSNRPDIQIGVFPDSKSLPYSILEGLKAKL